MRRGMTSFIPALAAVWIASAAEAQICAGFPTADREFTIGGNVQFPEGLYHRGAEISYNLPGPLSVAGGAAVVSLEDERPLVAQGVSAMASYHLLGSSTGAGGQVCPFVGLGYTWSDDFGTSSSLSGGLGLGINISMGRNFGVYPYIAPQVVLASASFEDGSSTATAISGGLIIGVGPVWIGPVATRLIEGDGDVVYGIRAGLRP
jgi:hypothetical protein